jgi:hypothetical protein
MKCFRQKFLLFSRGRELFLGGTPQNPFLQLHVAYCACNGPAVPQSRCSSLPSHIYFLLAPSQPSAMASMILAPSHSPVPGGLIGRQTYATRPVLVYHAREVMPTLCLAQSVLQRSARQCSARPGPLCDAAHANAWPVLVHYAMEHTPVLRPSWSTMRWSTCQYFARPNPLCDGDHANALPILIHYATECMLHYAMERTPVLRLSWSAV